MTSGDIKIALTIIRREFESLRDAVRNQRIVTDISGAATALDKAAVSLEKSSKSLEGAVRTNDMSTLQKSLIQLATSIGVMAKSVGNVKPADMSKTNSLLTDLARQVKNIKLDVPQTDLSRLDDVVTALAHVHDALTTRPPATDRTDEVIAAIKGIKVQIPESMKLDASQVGAIRFGGGSATASYARKAVSASVTMAVANTEYSYQFPSNTIGFRIKLRSQGTLLLYSWQTGTLPTSGDGSAYSTVQQNGELSRDNLDIGGKTIYLQAPSATQVAEVEVFTLQ